MAFTKQLNFRSSYLCKEICVHIVPTTASSTIGIQTDILNRRPYSRWSPYSLSSNEKSNYSLSEIKLIPPINSPTSNLLTNKLLLAFDVKKMSLSTSSAPTGATANVSPPRKEGEESNEKSSTSSSSPSAQGALSMKDKLKQAVRDYGATVLVFHVTMSLTSLGICYLLVSSGLDVVALLSKLGISESISQSKITEEAGKFVVAYAVHKVFAPLRITITLTATPLIVRKLRSMGILKQMAKPKTQ